MKPWLLVPLDDRPCCAQFPVQLAPLKLPPPELLGHFQTPGQCDALLDWLEREAPQASGAILALDMLTWGGLVASRSPRGDLEEALGRLRRLQRIPLKKLVFQTIMRNAPTQTTAEEMKWAEALVALSADPERSDHGIPEQILADYLKVRARNVAVYEAAKQADFDYLVFALDDSKTRGWNLRELAALGPVQAAPGTDETALLLACRALRPGSSVQLVWSHPELCDLQGLYEDRPAAQVLAAQAAVAEVNFQESSSQLWLYGRRTQPQIEAAFQTPLEPPSEWLERLEGALEEGRRVVLVDLTFANGGDRSLGEALHRRGWWSRLAGYAAWNTLGNRSGTGLATLVLGGNARFLAERIADDLLYQADYRWRAARLLGHPGLRLSPAEVQRVEAELFVPLAQQAREWTGQDLQFQLPWQRLFEVKIS